VDIPEEYIVQKFYQFAGYPKYKKHTNIYEGGCCICREGKSWGRKRRLYFIAKDNAICCHNCGWYSTPVKWICHVNNISYSDVIGEIKNGDYGYVDLNSKPQLIYDTPDLPKDSINIFDSSQLRYYKNNQILKKCLDVIAARRLDTAINRPKSLWLSLNDYIHKNRLILPFYDDNKIIHYQSRSVLPSDDHKPKYLSKVNSDKSLFNYDQIDSTLSDIFVFEGPIDSFFVKNGVACAGIQENSQLSFSKLQQKQIDKLWLMNVVWVLDSQWQDHASLAKTKKLIQAGHTVFIWPKSIGKEFKDFNEMACHYQMDTISPEFIKKYSVQGMKAQMLLTQIKQ
jgi:hypothetical protein